MCIREKDGLRQLKNISKIKDSSFIYTLKSMYFSE